MSRRSLVVGMLAAGGAMLCAAQASASFHLMQVEQVIGGVNGDGTAQAIQLRMRTGFQNILSASRLRAWDAAGLNPVLVKDMTTDVANFAAGAHVLITSASFNALTTPATTADFTMANVIPASYLAAGSLTFEDDIGTVYWRVSWGGAGYTGTGAGQLTNDLDGNFNPPVGIALPTTGTQAILFQGAVSALSTTNLNDYALTAGSATFTNNAGTSFLVDPPPPTGACCLSTGECLQTDDGLCNKLAGTFQGFGSDCGSANCSGAPTGACCLGNGGCLDAQTSAACVAATGVYQGDGTTCAAASCPQPCSADVNGSGGVNIDDLLAVINTWGPCAGCPSDINGNGQVNIDDLLAVINGWGPCP